MLVDLEPRVINGILSSDYGKLYNQENIFLGPEGSGAGNAWTRGYRSGKYVILFKNLFWLIRKG